MRSFCQRKNFPHLQWGQYYCVGLYYCTWKNRSNENKTKANLVFPIQLSRLIILLTVFRIYPHHLILVLVLEPGSNPRRLLTTNVTHKEVWYSPKEFLSFLILISRDLRNKYGNVFQGCGTIVAKNVHLDQAEFLYMGPWSNNSKFNVIVHWMKKKIVTFVWLLGRSIHQSMTHRDELEIPGIL